MFKETHPILGTRDIQRAIVFYTKQLGFKLAFGDKTDPPNYVGFCRGAVELHMQFQSCRKKGRTFSISVWLATGGKSFTAGFGIGWKISHAHPNEAKAAVQFQAEDCPDLASV
jgi:catechol 2,3-dioxygenase-like lactoylglutathione lyase family enzyme